MMQTKPRTVVTLVAALLLFSSAGWTADDDGEATIRLMGAAEAELPQAVTKQISIPTHLMQASESAQQHAVEKSAKGLEKANQRNENKSRQGTEEVRERSADMSEKAKENRENKGRSEDRPEPPQGPPGTP